MTLLLLALVDRPTLAQRYTLTPTQNAVVSTWLAKHAGYRLASDQDCGCNEDLQKIRREGYGGSWKPVPDYHPYAVIGDFNGGGEDDMAVAVVRAKDTQIRHSSFQWPSETRRKPVIY